MPKLKTVRPRLKTLQPRISSGVPRTEAERSRERSAVNPWRAWYKTKRWQDLRQRVLQRDGYRCRQTGALLIGRYPAGDSPTVDHIKPHRGDPVLFWDPDNLQAVAKSWHDREKQKLEHSGRA